MRDLDVILPLPKTSMFALPKDPEEIIPIPFGNWIDPTVLPDTDFNGGYTPAVCIDRVNLFYAVSPTSMVAFQPRIFFEGIRQSDDVAVWSPGMLIEGHLVSGLAFRLNAVLDGQVSVRTAGMVDASGTPILNLIPALYFMLTTYGGWTLDDFDRGTCEQTMHDIFALGYGPFVFCFNEEKTIRDWLLELLPAWHCDFTETGNGQLAIILDRSLTTFVPTVDYHVPFHEIVDQGSPVRSLAFGAHGDDVANQIMLHGRHNWVTNEATAGFTWNYLPSQSSYEDAFLAEFTFRSMYTLAHATAWLRAFLARHAFEPRTVRFGLRGLHGLALITPRFITVEWPFLNWDQHLLKIKKTTISFSRNMVLLECVDCQREVMTPLVPASPNPIEEQRRLPRRGLVPGTIGDEGQAVDTPVNTRNEAANGDFERGDNGQWDLKAGNAQAQWTMVQSATEPHQGVWYARSILGAGDGFSEALRHRVDPQEWVLVSAYFRAHSGGTNGQAAAWLTFYNQEDLFVADVAGNYVPPTFTYLESVAFGQAPIGSYYYRAGIAFIDIPTSGQWRADTVRAKSGTLAEIFTSRTGDVVSRNAIYNGDFELGSAMFSLGPNWIVSNDPQAAAHSGIWKAAHFEAASGAESRLNSLTAISVSPGQSFTLQAFAKTIGTPLGTARIGVTWLDAQKNGITENAVPPVPGPLPDWVIGSGTMTVPANALYAHVWIGVTNHTGTGGGSVWLFDDFFLSTG